MFVFSRRASPSNVTSIMRSAFPTRSISDMAIISAISNINLKVIVKYGFKSNCLIIVINKYKTCYELKEKIACHFFPDVHAHDNILLRLENTIDEIPNSSILEQFQDNTVLICEINRTSDNLSYHNTIRSHGLRNLQNQVYGIIADSIVDISTLFLKFGFKMREILEYGRQAIKYVDASFEASIPAINGALSVVLSGSEEAVTRILSGPKLNGVMHRKLNVNHAFHSPLTASMLEDYRKSFDSVKLQKPLIQIISTVQGQVANEEISSPDYWIDQQTVLYSQAVEESWNMVDRVFVEFGPDTSLTDELNLLVEDCKFRFDD